MSGIAAASFPSHAAPSRYRRREPERSLLHATVRDHLKTFLGEAAQHSDTGAGLPRFVAAEFERYLACGILSNGFARVRCTSCGDELLVAFSCKVRGFCPSCTTRRMQSTATNLVDRVLPHAPMRQWVLSLPRWARFLLARDAGLITRTLDVALREIFSSQRRRALRAGARAPQAGAVTFVQRFGGALNLNVHFHCVIPDGVFVREDGAVRFVALAPPSDDEVKAILHRIALRVRNLLRPRVEAADADARPPDVLTLAQAESVSLLRGKHPEAGRAKKQAAYLDGFSLHAGVHLHANDRAGLVHLCGYGARPPLSQDRLSALPAGRLATLVPPPRHHLVRYHGVFGPASRWRSEVVPVQPAPSSPCAAAPVDAAPSVAAPPPTSPASTSRIRWSELLLRVFREDVLSCPCGGRRVVLAFITEKKVIHAILEHLGLPTTGPPIAPARSTSPDEFTGWQDDVPEMQQYRH